jgi:hypothetical protein
MENGIVYGMDGWLALALYKRPNPFHITSTIFSSSLLSVLVLRDA